MTYRFRLSLCSIALMAVLTAAVAPSVFAQGRVDLTDRKPVGPPWLGVLLAKAEPGKAGVEVTGILRKSPADNSGIKRGDRVLSVAGEAVSSLEEIRLIVRGHKAGDTVPVVVQRGDARLTLKFVLQAQPSTQKILEDQLLGFSAPDFPVQIVEPDAKKTRLSAFKGKPTILEFWATWCGPCRLVSRDLAELKKKHGDAIHIVAVSSENPNVVKTFLRKHGAHYPVGHDFGGKGEDAYFVSSFPTVVILDPTHKVAAVVLGAGKKDLIDKKVSNLLSSSAAGTP